MSTRQKHIQYIHVLTSFTSRFSSEHPSHPLVRELTAKARLFDECSSQYNIPPIAVGPA